MNYIELRNYLLEQFQNNDFEGLLNTKRQQTINVRNDYNLNLTIVFPGYKAYLKNGHIVYDYRVNLNQIPVSHANIVIDIYNKSIQINDELKKILYNFLVDISYNALNVNINNYSPLLNFSFNNPTNQLINSIPYSQRIGNMRNYSFQELATIIPYIVLQEDINYPMPKYSGRRMSFYRYLEAIFCTKINIHDNMHNIREVIGRTNSHQRPELWKSFMDYYRPIIDIAKHS